MGSRRATNRGRKGSISRARNPKSRAERGTAARGGALSGRVDRRYRGSDHAVAAGTGEGARVSGAAGCVVARGRRRAPNQDALDGNLYQLYLELGGEGALANTGIKIKVARLCRGEPRDGAADDEVPGKSRRRRSAN